MPSYTRVVASICSGVLFFALGLICLFHNPRHRLSRSFAFFNFSLATWNLSFFSMYLPNPDIGFWVYRALHISEVFVTYNLIRFIQDVSETWNTRFSRVVRQISLGYVVLVGSLYFTPILISGYEYNSTGAHRFRQIVTPYYIVNLFVITAAMVGSWVATVHQMRIAGGLKRSQLLFAMLGFGFGGLGALCFAVALRFPSVPWLQYPFEMLMSLFFAITIYKYRLFDVSFILRRGLIYIGIYVPLLCLPFFLLPWLQRVFQFSVRYWWCIPSILISYAALFSLAPLFANFIREKTEQKRFQELKGQFDIIQETTERLAKEQGRSLDEIATQVLGSFKKFYRDKKENIVDFVVVYLVDQRGSYSVCCDPPAEIETPVLMECVQSLTKTPSLFSRQSFSRIEVENELASLKPAEVTTSLRAILRYLTENRIELCCPCVQDGKLYGLIFLGEKLNGHFWPEEVASLKLATSQIAMAVHNAELRKTTVELRDLDRLKNDLISNITHEFNSPLAVVDNALDLLSTAVAKGSITTEQLTSYVGMIRKNTARLAQFVQNLWEIQRIQQAKVELNLMETDLASVVRKCAELVISIAHAKSLRVNLKLEEPLLAVVDEDKIKQVVGNFITNAIKFTEEGDIDIVLKRNGDRAIFSVKDCGRGIDPKFLEMLFDRFFQVPEERRVARGMGLGLAIAKGWAQAHGGRVWAESQGLGHGSTFTLELPLNLG